MIDKATQNLLAILRKQAYLVKHARYMDDDPDELTARLDDVAYRIEGACNDLEVQLNLLATLSTLAAPTPNDRWLDPSWPESGVERWTK